MAQQVVLVDKNNRKIGIMEKIKAHKESKLHRAFSIFVFNSKGELLLQRRAQGKYHSGGLWSNTVCSHPKPNETYQQAVHKRLKEEMGFDCSLKKLFCFKYKIEFKNELLTENEYDCVFIGKFNKNPSPNLNEVMDFKWISLKYLKSDIEKNPKKYTYWLKVAIRKIRLSQIKKILEENVK